MFSHLVDILCVGTLTALFSGIKVVAILNEIRQGNFNLCDSLVKLSVDQKPLFGDFIFRFRCCDVSLNFSSAAVTHKHPFSSTFIIITITVFVFLQLVQFSMFNANSFPEKNKKIKEETD